MSSYDFSGLTPRQQWLILYQGWRLGQKFPDGSNWPQPQRRTVKKLIDRGLMEAVETRIASVRTIPMTFTEYRVPLRVHAAFCLHSSEKEPANV